MHEQNEDQRTPLRDFPEETWYIFP